MLAGGRIKTGVGDLEPLHRPIADDMRLHDFLGVGERHVAVPHGLGIHDYGWSMLALVEASGLVGAHGGLDACDGEKALEFAMQIGSARRIATAAWMAGGALIAAYKNMFCEFRHGSVQNRDSNRMSLQ